MKKIRVTLAYDPNPPFGRKSYQIQKLTNALEIDGYYVCSQLDGAAAQKIVNNRKYEVTVVPA